MKHSAIYLAGRRDTVIDRSLGEEIGLRSESVPLNRLMNFLENYFVLFFHTHCELRPHIKI
jgi:hypothetical protein